MAESSGEKGEGPAKKPAAKKPTAAKPARPRQSARPKAVEDDPAAKKPAKPRRAARAKAVEDDPAAKRPAKPRQSARAKAVAKEPAPEKPPTPRQSAGVSAPAKEPAARKPPKPRRSARAKAVEEVARGYFAALSARDAQGMADHFHPDGIDDIVPLAVFRGPGEVREMFDGLFAAMPDAETVVTRVVADHEAAGVQWRMSGTFDGAPFQGIQPTARRVHLRGFDLMEIDEDLKITRNTGYYDGAEFARAVGMLPARDSGAERAMTAGFNAVAKIRRQLAARR